MLPVEDFQAWKILRWTKLWTGFENSSSNTNHSLWFIWRHVYIRSKLFRLLNFYKMSFTWNITEAWWICSILNLALGNNSKIYNEVYTIDIIISWFEKPWIKPSLNCATQYAVLAKILGVNLSKNSMGGLKSINQFNYMQLYVQILLVLRELTRIKCI